MPIDHLMVAISCLSLYEEEKLDHEPMIEETLFTTVDPNIGIFSPLDNRYQWLHQALNVCANDIVESGPVYGKYCIRFLRMIHIRQIFKGMSLVTLVDTAGVVEGSFIQVAINYAVVL
jgi:ribosome-binding ATPase YchF (GTP1/OBG family)